MIKLSSVVQQLNGVEGVADGGVTHEVLYLKMINRLPMNV